MAGQVWGVAADGGYLYADQLSNYLRMQVLPTVKFRQLCDIRESDKNGESLIGRHKGDKWNWNVFSKVQTKGAALVETNTMPETKFTIEQNQGTITEYGNSVPYTGKLDDLSEQPVREIIRKVLKIDCKEAFDIAAHAQMNATPLRVTPTAGNNDTTVVLVTNGTPTVTNNIAFGKGHAGTIADLMKERDIPGYDNDDYVAVGWPTTFTQLKADLEAIHQYVETGLAQIKNGEIGRYRGIRFIEQSHIPKGGRRRQWHLGSTNRHR